MYVNLVVDVVGRKKKQNQCSDIVGSIGYYARNIRLCPKSNEGYSTTHPDDEENMATISLVGIAN